MKYFFLCLITQAAFAATEWKIDSVHSSANFKIRHMMVSNVAGTFTGGMEGAITSDDKELKKFTANATIDATTISTNNTKRDEHLKSEDFFDVKKHPKITFKSKRAVGDNQKTFQLVGDLTMHGVTKEITLEVTSFTPEIKDPKGNFRRGLSCTGKIDRKDFGIKWNTALEAGGLTLGETVDLNIEVEMLRPGEKPKAS